MAKTLKLTDKRGCSGETVKELRMLLKEIDQDDIVGLSFAAIRRDGTL